MMDRFSRPDALPSGSTPLLAAMLEIRESPYAVERAYIARLLVQCPSRTLTQAMCRVESHESRRELAID